MKTNKRVIGSLIAVGLSAMTATPREAGSETPGNAANPQAIKEVVEGKRSVANAAWWGFNEEDSTGPLQAAIKSGAKRVVVPNMTKDWIVRPIQLAGNQELILEDGVVITAKRGEYRSRGASVFTAQDVSNLVMRGYGATVRMQKEDYIVGDVLARLGWNRWFGKYEKAEWRTTLALLGATNAKVSGLTLRDSGGDGIYVDGGKQGYSRNISIRDVLCDNHYRQGISIISVDGLLVENSAFNNTWGTPPSSGVDIEPDSPKHRVRDVVFRNCRFLDNYGDGIEVFLAHLKAESGDVSILFDNCRVSSRRGTGIRVTKVPEEGVGGLIEFRNCVVENTEGFGIKVQDKSAARARVKFVSCSLRNTANNRMYGDAWTPIWIQARQPATTKKPGGIDFVDCSVEDHHDRPAIMAGLANDVVALFDVTGKLKVRNPFGVRADLGKKQEGVTLVVEEE